MKKGAKAILEEALKLPPKSRAAIAGSLLMSLDDQVDEDAEEAWSAELAKRIKEIDEGKIRMIPWSEARKRILED
jgi:putative addiction module component (TIGR02574 family)